MKDKDDLVFIMATGVVALVCFMANPILGFIMLVVGIVLYGIGSGAFDD